ncbi:hypothetical protein STEG23_015156 [Scotinomys teguina]
MAVMLLPGTNGSLLLVQRTVTRTMVLQETFGKELLSEDICKNQFKDNNNNPESGHKKSIRFWKYSMLRKAVITT